MAWRDAQTGDQPGQLRPLSILPVDIEVLPFRVLGKLLPYRWCRSVPS